MFCQCGSTQADPRTLSSPRWNDFRFDATANFLKKFRNFELLFAQMGFALTIKMIKISKQIGDWWYVSTASQMSHSALGTVPGSTSLWHIEGDSFIKVPMTTFLWYLNFVDKKGHLGTSCNVFVISKIFSVSIRYQLVRHYNVANWSILSWSYIQRCRCIM